MDVLKTRYVSRKKITEQTDLSISTLQRLRQNQWEEGVHFIRIARTTVRYNLEMVLVWMALRHDPEAYAKVLAEFKASLSSIN